MIQGIVLAAGMGRRMGGAKALLTLAGETFHQRALSTLRGAGLEVVVVVNPLVNGAIPPPLQGEHRVVNPDPDQQGGMFTSVRMGVARALSLAAAGAILLPVDHPLVTSDDVKLVSAALLDGAEIAVATHGGRRGHPIGVSRLVMAEIVGEPATTTLRDIVRRKPSRVVEVAVSQGSLLGVNTPEDLEEVSNRTFR